MSDLPRPDAHLDRRVTLILAMVTLLILSCFEHSRDWNSATRFLLTHALVDQHTFEVTPYVASGGQLLEHPPTLDLAGSPDGRFFCDKAPGLSILGVVPYAILRGIGYPPASNMAGQPEPTDYLVTIFTVGVAAAVMVVGVYRLARTWDATPEAAWTAAMSSLLASHQVIYGTLYYGHVLAGSLLLTSLLLYHRQQPQATLAGLLAGLAITTEYTAAIFSASLIVVECVACLGLRRTGSPRALAGFLLGHIAPLAALATYHQQITGSPFRVPYTLEVAEDFQFHREGMGLAIGPPTGEALLGLLFDLDVGLLIIAPTVLFALAGWFVLVRRRPREAITILLASVGLYLAIAGFPEWHAGWATGPRLLLPILPLAWAPIACVIQGRFWKIAGCFVAMVTAQRLIFINTTSARPQPGQPWTWWPDGPQEGHLGAWICPSMGNFCPFFTCLIVALLVLLSYSTVYRRSTPIR